MPLWLELLRTPMAAPETARLRRLRMAWQLLCVLTALCVAFFSPMRALMGRAALYLVAIILALTLLQSLLYWNAKQRADNRLFDRGEEGE